MENKYWAFVVLVLGLVMSSPVFAVCSNNEDGEAGQEGEVEYFSGDSMLRYCDGTNWIDMVLDDTFGFVSHWKFEETSGTTYADSVGSNDGTYSEAAVVSATGIIDNAANFVASNDYTNAGSDASLDISDGSISLWFYTPNADVSSNRYLVAKDGSGNNAGDFGLLIKNSTDGGNPSKIELVTNNGSSNNSIFSDSDIVGDEWTHLVVNFGTGGKQMYINNVLQSDTDTNTTGMTNAAANFVIGNLRVGNSLDFDGDIDDLRLYDVRLSADEITELFEMGVDGSSLVAHWKFDETSGTSVADATGNSAAGTMQNGLDASNDSVTGPIGNALHMDTNGASAEDKVDASLATEAQSLSQISYSFWAKLDTIPTFGNRFFEYIAGQNKMFINANDEIYIALDDGPSPPAQWNTSGLNLTTDTWYHIVLTYDNASTSNNPILYVNGSSESLTETQAPGSVAVDAATQFVMGNRNDATKAIEGAMDDFRIYNRVINAEEVSVLYSRGFEVGLVGHWKFDETTGTTAADSSGNGYDGTMQNGLDAGNDNVTGVLDRALEFDASDDFVSVADNAVWDLSNSNSTFATWFKADPTQPDPFPRFLDRFTGSGFNGYRLGLDSGGDNIQFFYGGTDDANMTSAGTYNDDQWHHVAVTLDGSTARMYINGTLDTTDSYSALTDHTQALQIGGASGSNNVLNGALDDVRIYDYALTPSEITILAVCTGPGIQFYNFTDDVMQWCDNIDNARNMYAPASGSGGCTTPTASEGALNYDTDRYKGCDGNGWIDIGK